MCKWVMRCMGVAGCEGTKWSQFLQGQYLQYADVEGRGGLGTARFTSHVEKAKVFETAADAMAFWHSVPKCRPRRDDGLPNKPLTAYHMEIINVEAEADAAD